MKKTLCMALFLATQLFAVEVPPLTEGRAQALKDLRWGMFICWSFSTFSGFEWSPNQKDLSIFKATQVDTAQWVKTAKEAEMGYILFLAKHHDGFCLWDTKTTERKVTRSALGRDVLAELRRACDAQGIKLALYFSEGDWSNPAGQKEGAKAAPNPDLKKAQLKELLTQYGSIEYIWFDCAVGDGGLSHPETVAWCRQFQPGCLIGFNHGDQTSADIRLGEMGTPKPLTQKGASRYQAAEFTYPILPPHKGGANWFYSLPKHDSLCHPAEKLYADYREARAHENIFSINVGPGYTGKLREIDITTLRQVGAWIREGKTP